MSHIAISIPRVDWKPLKGCLELQSTSRLTELLPLGGAGVCKESSAFTKHLSSGTSTASCRILLPANRLDSVHHFGHGIVSTLRCFHGPRKSTSGRQLHHPVTGHTGRRSIPPPTP